MATIQSARVVWPCAAPHAGPSVDWPRWGLTSRWARRAIWLIVAAAVLRALVWVVVLPPWQGPDEGAHYSYIERIAVEHSIPPFARDEVDHYSGGPRHLDGLDGVLAGRDAAAAPAAPARHERVPARAAEPLGTQRRHASDSPTTRRRTTCSAPSRTTSPGCIPRRRGCTRSACCRRCSAACSRSWSSASCSSPGRRSCSSLLGTAAFSQLPMVTQSSAIANPDIMLQVGVAGLAGEPPARARRPDAASPALRAAVGRAHRALEAGRHARRRSSSRSRLLGIGAAGTSWRMRAAVAAALGAVLRSCSSRSAGRPGVPLGQLVRYGMSYMWQFYLPRLWYQLPAPTCRRGVTRSRRGGSGSRRASGASAGSRRRCRRGRTGSVRHAPRGDARRRVRLHPPAASRASRSPPPCSPQRSATCCCCTCPSCCS